MRSGYRIIILPWARVANNKRSMHDGLSGSSPVTEMGRGSVSWPKEPSFDFADKPGVTCPPAKTVNF
jgi:hypothetical protein